MFSGTRLTGGTDAITYRESVEWTSMGRDTIPAIMQNMIAGVLTVDRGVEEVKGGQGTGVDAQSAVWHSGSINLDNPTDTSEATIQFGDLTVTVKFAQGGAGGQPYEVQDVDPAGKNVTVVFDLNQLNGETSSSVLAQGIVDAFDALAGHDDYDGNTPSTEYTFKVDGNEFMIIADLSIGASENARAITVTGNSISIEHRGKPATEEPNAAGVTGEPAEASIEFSGVPQPGTILVIGDAVFEVYNSDEGTFFGSSDWIQIDVKDITDVSQFILKLIENGDNVQGYALAGEGNTLKVTAEKDGTAATDFVTLGGVGYIDFRDIPSPGAKFSLDGITVEFYDSSLGTYSGDADYSVDLSGVTSVGPAAAVAQALSAPPLDGFEVRAESNESGAEHQGALSWLSRRVCHSRP